MNRIAVLFTSALLLAGSAVAQESAPQEQTRVVTLDGPVSMPGMNVIFQNEANQQLEDNLHQKLEKAFFVADLTSPGELVTNAPYTATATEENTQTLADGNRIVHKSSDFVARDSQGRTRRETTLTRVGPVQVDTPKMILINDPTTHTQYVLAPGDATKVVKSEGTWTNGPTVIDLQTQNGERRKRIAEQKVTIARAPGAQEATESDKQVKNEDLGTQTIEGVSAQGHRETVTIAAGEIGNDRPIEIVSETWFSPDLHTVVLRKHADPRIGETVFRLTNISRTEPDASLFQPPPNVKIKSEPMIELKRREGSPKD